MEKANNSFKTMDMVKCHKCKNRVDSKSTVGCSVCKNKYEFECIGLSEKLYRIMTTENKKNWKCKSCQTKCKNAIRKDNETTTNVTLRKKPTQSTTTSNSGNSDCNKSSPTTISSQNNAVIDSQSCDSHLITKLDSSNESLMLSSTSVRLSRSVECILDVNTDIIDLKDENERLKSELQITQNELENAIIENIGLQRKVSKLTSDVAILKGLCQSPILLNPTPKQHPSHKKKRLSMLNELSTPLSSKQRRFFPDDDVNNFDREHDFVLLQEKITRLLLELANAKDEILRLTKELESLERTVHDSSYKRTNQANSNNIIDNTGEIKIYGTQQCVGLASALLLKRQHTAYEKYLVTANTKPNATTKEVLRGCYEVSLRSQDKLVICVGENDCTPTAVLTNLKQLLNKFTNSSIIVLSVLNNKFLNPDMLNRNIKDLCKDYKNCHYINCNSKYYTSITDICNFVNYTIDCIDYNFKYLDCKQIKKFINRCSNPSFQSNKTITWPKGTIPYYFQPKNSTTEKCINKTNAKPGTIPYYFNKYTDRSNKTQHCIHSITHDSFRP